MPIIVRSPRCLECLLEHPQDVFSLRASVQFVFRWASANACEQASEASRAEDPTSFEVLGELADDAVILLQDVERRRDDLNHDGLLVATHLQRGVASQSIRNNN